jgi:hypothetical protein
MVDVQYDLIARKRDACFLDSDNAIVRRGQTGDHSPATDPFAARDYADIVCRIA